MPGKVIGTSLGLGYAGTQSRTADAIIQNRIADGNINFGMAVKLTDANKWKLVGSGDEGSAVAGVAVREVVQANQYDPQSNAGYLSGDPCDVMTRGNVIVKCQRGTPTSGSAVYVRIIANDSYPTAVVGGFEASSDSTNSVQVSNIEWTTGQIDANGMAEITIKTRAKG